MSGKDADTLTEAHWDVEAWRRAIKEDNLSNYHLEMGVAVLTEGALDKALEHFQRAATIKPSLDEAHYWAVELLQRLGRQTEANSAHETALKHVPDYRSNALLEIGLRQIGNGAEEKALASLAAAEQAGAEPGLVVACRGLLHLSRAEPAQAEGCIQNADAWEGRWTARLAQEFGSVVHAALHRKDHRSAHLAFAHACKLMPDFGTEHDFMKVGQSYQRNGKLVEALACYRQAAALGPKSIWNHIYLGVAHQILGQWAPALDALNQAIATDPQNPWTHFQHGILLQHCDRLEEAVAAYDRGLAVDGNNFWGLQNRASALDALGRPDAAQASRHQAETQAPNNLWAAYYQAAMLVHRERGAEADALLRHVENRLPELSPADSALFHLLRGAALRTGGECAAALPLLESASALLLDNPWPDVNRVAALATLAQEEATVLGASLVERFPDLGWAWLVYGNALAACGKTREARMAYQTGLNRAPGVGWADFFMGGIPAAERERARIAANLE